GFKVLKREFDAARVLLKPTVIKVPVENPWLYRKLAVVVFWVKTLVPVKMVLASGVVACSIDTVPEITGSKLSMRGPSPVVNATMPPTPAPAPPTPMVVPPAPPPVVPVVDVPVPPAEVVPVVPPGVPCTRPAFTPSATAPALVRRRSVSAIDRL